MEIEIVFEEPQAKLLSPVWISTMQFNIFYWDHIEISKQLLPDQLKYN